MMPQITDRFHKSVRSFNMTPIIDIVFLLIIFFLVVCQFIEAENFPVKVPDKCNFALEKPDSKNQVITVTVMKMDKQKVEFAVGPEKITVSNPSDIISEITKLINIPLKELPAEQKIVTLRIDKDICFNYAQYALAAVAASSATDIQLAVTNTSQTGQ